MIYNFNTQPYIVLNGVSSRTIKGLIVSSLPPISKPAMRYNAEEVDGRDGDIITPLGYAAYDKVAEIGLSREYDIDDIIAFFNSSGKAVFSNEPDKYYNYAIYEQVDFERLIRFKTASVTFHVQPFKFSDNEGEKVFTNARNAGVHIRNNGNIYSRPTIEVLGAGAITISLNGSQVLSIALPSTGRDITIDCTAFNAYDTASGAYLNRLVTGNYDNLRLQVGRNIITCSGNVTELRISNYSRWI